MTRSSPVFSRPEDIARPVRPRRILPRRSLMALAVLAAIAALAMAGGSARAQEPWLGWHGPPTEGAYGMRFGMDRASVEAAAVAAGLTLRRSRPGTLRFEGKLEGQSVEVVADFLDDALGGLGGRLTRLLLRWPDLPMAAGKAVDFFGVLEQRLGFQHGAALVHRDSSPGELSTGDGVYQRLYRDVELQAVLELKAPRPERYDLSLLMDYPQLTPELAGS